MNISHKILEKSRAEIAETLRSKREGLGMTQQELADKCGIGVATIKRFEGGKFYISTRQLITIAHYLDCKIQIT